jgi:hypothetical protein
VREVTATLFVHDQRTLLHLARCIGVHARLSFAAIRKATNPLPQPQVVAITAWLLQLLTQQSACARGKP